MNQKWQDMNQSVYKLRLCMTVMMMLTPSAIVLAAGTHGKHHGEGETVIGKPGKIENVSRTIEVTMSDEMRFTPSNIKVKQGETVRFVAKNVGEKNHEMSLGTKKDLLEHLKQMKKFPEMAHKSSNSITVVPGASGEIVWQFTQSGKVDFACLIPGHYEGGMYGAVSVIKK